MLDIEVPVIKENKEIIEVLPDVEVQPDETPREFAYLDFTTPQSTARFVQWAIKRSGLSKSEIARRMGISRTSLQPYYNLKRGRNVGMRWIVRIVSCLGGRMFVEVPLGMPKPRGRGKINQDWKPNFGDSRDNS
jgi:DNA-binding phage protein